MVPVIEEGVGLQHVFAAPGDEVEGRGGGAARQDVDDQDHSVAELVADESCWKMEMDSDTFDW